MRLSKGLSIESVEVATKDGEFSPAGGGRTTRTHFQGVLNNADGLLRLHHLIHQSPLDPLISVKVHHVHLLLAEVLLKFSWLGTLVPYFRGAIATR